MRSPKGSRLPNDWKPTIEMLEYVKDRRPDLNPDAVTEDFAEYWQSLAGVKAIKLDWLKTWKTWVRNQSKPRNGFNQPTGETAWQKSQRERVAQFAPSVAKRAPANEALTILEDINVATSNRSLV